MYTDVYRVNGITIDEGKFKDKIINALAEYNFATIEQLVVILKAKAIDIANVLDAIIISYIKENPGKSYAEVCMDLNVRSEFIEKLIKEGRIELKVFPLDELKKKEQLASLINNVNVKEIQKHEAILGLQKSFYKTDVVVDKVIKKGPRFYTNNPNKK